MTLKKPLKGTYDILNAINDNFRESNSLRKLIKKIISFLAQKKEEGFFYQIFSFGKGCFGASHQRVLRDSFYFEKKKRVVKKLGRWWWRGCGGNIGAHSLSHFALWGHRKQKQCSFLSSEPRTNSMNQTFQFS